MIAKFSAMSNFIKKLVEIETDQADIRSRITKLEHRLNKLEFGVNSVYYQIFIFLKCQFI